MIKMVMLVLLLTTALLLTYPLYQDRLEAQMAERERIKDMDTYEEEGRYLETLYIMDYHSRQQRLSEVLFGVKLFDSYEFGQQYFGRDRPIHSDFNMVFYSTGLLGLILFSILITYYFLIGNGQISGINRSLYFPLLTMFFMVLIPGRFIGTLTYAPLLLLLLSAIKMNTGMMETQTTNDKCKINNGTTV